MGSAWYPRAAVLALRAAQDRAERRHARGEGADLRARPSDGALIAYLRERPRTIVDLVADTGISIARAERVYRFWAAHDTRPAPTAEPTERRSTERLERETLLRQLKNPDPRARAEAFESLKRLRTSP
jgi:hypothetical protein